VDPSPPFGTNADDRLRILPGDGGVVAWVDAGGGHRPLEPLWDDGDRLYCRTWRNNAEGVRHELMAVLPVAEHPAPTTVSRLAHEFALKDYLDGAWAAKPLELVHSRGRTLLLLEFNCTSALDSLLSKPLELGRFLRLAPAIAHAIGQLHERGLIHKDIKPANILLDPVTEQVWLTGFGIASRLPRERQAPEPPEFIAGTLAYMAPEQTGRMNRSVDSRSDLYALGVTFYRMLTGALPFAATDPMEWVHCHIARKPLAPDKRFTEIPSLLSDIVMKLLAKTAEERYQTALGLEQDLRHCASQWEIQQRIEPFTLGRHDLPGRLLIPENLYGRAREIAVLQNAFDTIVKHPTTALVLVSGYTGIGKSSVVNELHKALVSPRGLFASGKCDQYKRDIPYATLAQAFQRLIRPILAQSEAELGRWRETLLHALEPRGALIVDLVPQLKLIVGEQEPVPELPASDAQRRFQLLLRRFIGVFARPENPLALFLDDLQWIDAATLDLLEDLLTQESIPHLLLIGAYRDNEVDAANPLMRKLRSIKAAGTSSVDEIILGPLDARHVSQLIADALHCETDQVEDLAELILQKTAGNPFFINQFLSTLADEGLIAFDSVHSRWSWDLKRIHAKGYTDNVTDLMIGKLVRLPAPTQEALQQLACLGNIATTAMLAIVHDTTEQDLHASLVEARRQELVEFLESSYRFVHDRVHEAAYALIPTERRPAMHLRVGRMLVARTLPGKLDEAIFEIVNQLNRASSLVAAPEEREQLAEFNLLAGKRAQASSAYLSALNYLTAGAALLTEDSWLRRRELSFALELNRAHCELASGTIAEAEERLRRLSSRAVTTGERVAVACLQVDLYQGIDRSEEAVAVGLRALRHLGIDLPERPTEADARRAYDGIWTRLGARAIEDLINLPLMTDPDSLAALDLLIRVAVPGHFVNFHLFAVAVCTAVSLGLEQGHSDASCIAYAQLGTLGGALFGQFDAGYRFGRLGCELVERPELQRFQARVFETFGFVVPWTQRFRKGREFLFRGFDLASRLGEIGYAGYACGQLNTNYLIAGDPLIDAQEQAQHGLAFARRVGFGIIEGWILGQLGLIRSMRGLTTRLGSFDEGTFRERDLERDLAGNPALALTECWYYIRKLQARFLAGEYVDALQAAAKAQPMLWGTVSLLEIVEYHFYDALCHAAVHDSASSEGREYHFARLTEHLEKLDNWAHHCPENFANRAALVGAELARIEGRELDAERLYERAISSARAADLVHNEALANELAGRFNFARGFERVANAYFREALDCYLRWGADGKVRQLDRLYPHLAGPEGQRPATVIGSAVQHLDVASVVKASQALSSEIELPKLIERLMTIAIENAGADRALLILPAGGEYLIRAEARASGDRIEVTMGHEAISRTSCPESLIRYVIRTQESVILDDASKPSLFSGDQYLHDRQSKSILTLPLIKQQQLTGILFLENTLTSHAFTPHRIAVLELLTAQAAISLENTRLYGDLQEREARVRRLIDSNIVGIVIWGLEGEIIDANDAFLKMVGYDRNDLATGTMRWTELTPPNWRGAAEERVADLKAGGSFQPYEKEYYRKDGSKVPVLVGGATFSGTGDQGFAFVIDLTDRKRAEAERARALEALSLRDLQLRLLVDSIAAPVALMTPTGEVDVVNSFVLDYFGKTQEELKRWATIDAVHPDDLPDAIAAWTAAVESGQPYEIESRHRRADGIYRWFQIRGFPIRDTDGRVVRWCVLQTDIDDRKQAEAEARESERRYREIQMELAHVNRVATMGQLTASIAHEVNQPIAATLTNAETAMRWLAREPPDLEKAKQAINRIVNEGTRAADIISGIRGLVKKAPSRKGDLAIDEMILEVIALTRGDLSRNHIHVREELAKDLPIMQGDRVQLQQVILNLIVNAIEAMSQVSDRTRDMLISAMNDSDSVRIAVQDSGPGLPQAGTERVFEAFFTTKPSGLGMGLSICRSIVEAHGGRLWTTPNEPHGAVFCFTLPIGEKSLEN
jgi:PAS domain S-box-containing protein